MIYSTYETLRSSGRAHWTGRTWLIPKFHDVEQALKLEAFTARRVEQLFDKSLFSSSAPAGFEELVRHLKSWTFFSDPKDSKVDRKLIWEILGPAKFSTLPDELNRFLASTSLGGLSQIDLLNSISRPIRKKVVAMMLNVSEAAAQEICDFSDPVFELITASSPVAAEKMEVVEKAIAGMNSLLPKLASADIMKSELVAESQAADVLSQLMLLAVVSVFIDKAVANVLQVLLVEPSRWHSLKTSPQDINSYIHEALRLESPTQITSRIATVDIDFAGQKFLAGQAISLLIGSANRDEEVYPAAAEFNPRRESHRTLTFGLGGKRCPGEWLTSTVVKTVVLNLLNQRIDFSRAQLNYEWTKNQESRRLKALSVQL